MTVVYQSKSTSASVSSMDLHQRFIKGCFFLLLILCSFSFSSSAPLHSMSEEVDDDDDDTGVKSQLRIPQTEHSLELNDFSPSNNISNITLTTFVYLTWSGVFPCSNSSCNNTKIPRTPFACSYGDGEWNSGEAGFTDPIPPGNILVEVNITFYGQFWCNHSIGEPTFYATLDDDILVWSKFPGVVKGCSCSHCVQSASFTSEEQFNNLNGYNYGGMNIFQIEMVTNEICLNGVNITFFYQPIDVLLLNITPTSGPINGETMVNLTGTGFNQTTSAKWICRFGNNSDWTKAIVINNNTLGCVAPPTNSPGNVTVQVSSNDGEYFSPSTITFTYYGLPLDLVSPEHESILQLLTTNWWILLIGSLLLLSAISAFILTFKGRSKQKPGRKGDLHNRHSKQSGDTSSLLHSGSYSIYGTIKEDIDVRELEISERIGRGNFGEIFVANWRGIVVAVKKTKLPLAMSDVEKEEFLNDFEREASIMRSLRHPNVLQFLGICTWQSEICIIMEYMHKGSLFKILQDKTIELDWDLRIRIGVDISRGMNYLHKCDPIIIHRDLKSHNLLVDNNYKVKVSDFGLAKLLIAHESQAQMTSCGTPAYTAPEVLRNERYNEKVDVFSFAVVLWELVTREEPHHGIPPFQIVFSVGNQGVRPVIPSACPLKLGELMEECWNECAEDRPSFEEITSRLEKMTSTLLP